MLFLSNFFLAPGLARLMIFSHTYLASLASYGIIICIKIKLPENTSLYTDYEFDILINHLTGNQVWTVKINFAAINIC